jgi:hypothetical protein
MKTSRRLLFILTFGPALLFYPVGFFVTVCRLAWESGHHAAVQLAAELLSWKKENTK